MFVRYKMDLHELSLFSDVPLHIRRMLFFGVCIWIRLILAQGTYRALLSKPAAASALVAAISAFAVYRNSNTQPVWWSRTAHGISAFVVMLLAIMNLTGTHNYSRSIRSMMVTDVLFGTIWAVLKQC